MNEPTSAAVLLPAQFEVRPFQPDGGYSSLASAVLIGTEVVAGAALGFLVSFIGQWFYMVLVFAFFIGLVLGGIGQALIRAWHIRSPWLGGVAGLLGGCVAMTMMQYFDYQRFAGERDEAQQQLPVAMQRILKQDAAGRERLLQLIPAGQRNELRGALKEHDRMAAVKSFPDYLHYAATAGVSIGSSHDFNNPDRGFNLGYWGTIVYWLVELGIVAAIALAMGYNASRQPYCAAAKAWKEQRILGQIVAPNAICQKVIDQLKHGRFEHPNVAAAGISRETVQLVAFVSPLGTEQEVDLRIEKLAANPKGEVSKTIEAELTFPGPALAAMESLFVGPSESQPILE